MQMKTLRSLKTPVTLYQSTGCNISTDLHLLHELALKGGRCSVMNHLKGGRCSVMNQLKGGRCSVMSHLKGGRCNVMSHLKGGRCSVMNHFNKFL
jgi:hypothetical protein